MKTFPIASPPEHAGIYALKNRKTGQIYVGRSTNLRRRYAEWKGALVQRLGLKNKKFFEAIEQSSAEDWEFVVVLELPGVTDTELAAAEAKAITRVSNARPQDILNGLVPPEEVEKGPSSQPKSKVLADDGSEVDYASAAAQLGTSTEALRKRLQKYRSRGVYAIALSVLKAKSDRYRETRNE